MGLFDYVRCAAPLDDRVGINDVFQTKDLDCCMKNYWIDPAGYLWQKDNADTYDIIEESEESLFKARQNREWLPPFRPVLNGNHGRVYPERLTRTVTIYPANWRSKVRDKLRHSDWPTYELVFRDGKLILLRILS
jgi:hypothetical protein